MEDKEPCTPQDIAEWAMKAANQSEGMSLSQATRILTMIEAFGKAQYNQALIDAAENAKVKTKVIANDFGTVEIDVWPFVDKQSILKLKKQ